MNQNFVAAQHAALGLARRDNGISEELPLFLFSILDLRFNVTVPATRRAGPD
jgi:hypothetical protein